MTPPLLGEVVDVSNHLKIISLTILPLPHMLTCVRVFSGQKTRFSSGMKTLAPATAAPRTVITVSRCSTLSTSSSHTVRMIVTASTEPQMKATFLAITVARGLHLRYTLGRGPKMKNGRIDEIQKIQLGLYIRKDKKV